MKQLTLEYILQPMKKLSFWSSVFAGLFLFTFSAPLRAQQATQTKGTEFWAGFMENYVIESGDQLYIYISASVNTTGVVEVPGQGWSQPFTVTAFQTTTVPVPNNIAEHYNNQIIDNKGVRITTADTASVYSINFNQYTADGARILPIQTLGTEYLISSYSGLDSYGSQFLVVATEDQTEVEITPTAPTLGNNPAGVPFTVVLNAGQSYQVRVSGSGTDFTGTSVRSTSAFGGPKPIAVFGGVRCTNIPVGCTACDHIYDQCMPLNTWGTEVAVVPFSFANGYTYRIMAQTDGTVMSVNGGAPITLDAGEFQEYNNVNTPQCVSSNGAINVTQYMQGASCAGQADPAMVNLNDLTQTIDEATFTTLVSPIITQHGLNLILPTADVGTLLLDGVAIPAGSFQPFPGCSGHSYAQLLISQGNHTLVSENGFIGYLWGHGLYESYVYTLGSFIPTPDCAGVPGGTAYLDDCEICVEGTTGLLPCVLGCTDGVACNYDPLATVDDGSCEYLVDCAGVCGGTSIIDDCDICYDPFDDGLNVQEFNFSGSAQTFTVPFGVDSIFVELYGAQGGNSGGCNVNDFQTDGGLGGYTSGYLQVTEGDVFYVYVGGKGGTNGGSGWNGGGAGGNFAGGGGGATDIRTSLGFLSTRRAVAGGGGGGSYGCNIDYGAGGNGGGLTGQPGQAFITGTGGGGGGQFTGGVAGSSPANAGNFGNGGSTAQSHVAGGGGGWYGGGSAYRAGGGGGSSYYNGVLGGATQAGIHEGNGLVRISYQVIVPPCFYDCNNVLNGDAFIDECGECVEGDTGLTACIPGCTDPVACNYDPEATDDDGSCAYIIDCNGTCGGDFVTDACGVCYDPNGEIPFCEEACDGEFYSDPAEVPVVDCFGVCGGGAVIDECGECGGNNASCTDCAGIVNGPNIENECGACYDPNEIETFTTTYNFTGSVQSFVVPAGVSSLSVELYGAQGADSQSCVDGETSQADGGLGGLTEGEISVVAGQTLYLYVGGKGGTSGTGGWNGGGAGGQYGGGGGGATDIRTTIGNFASRLIVAGGGGAGNTGCPDAGAGGNGGGLTGAQGTSLIGNIGGGGGTQVSGGAVGTTPAQPGSFGNGGGVFGGNISGGGGGWYGGGGAFRAGGGGGSSYLGNAQNASTTAGVNDGPGYVIISYQVLPECIPGCTLPDADNYDPNANVDDGSCIYAGCTDVAASNYDPSASTDDGSCIYPGCTDPEALNYDPQANEDDGSCIVEGCTDALADNYDATATVDDGSCFYLGCTDASAANYDPTATVDDGSCEYPGCTDPAATNFDPAANVDDGSCEIPGCTNPEAWNYNAAATVDDGSCEFPGCTDPQAVNYDPNANLEDGSCDYLGCTDPLALNYDPAATIDDGSCEIPGCTDAAAVNYNPSATLDDGSCEFPGCTDSAAANFDPNANVDDGSCEYLGCTDPTAVNYDPAATIDDGSCEIPGCTDAAATNYNPSATIDDGSCEFPGCTDPAAANYDPIANVDDGSCDYLGCTDPTAVNYDANATIDDGSCDFLGCTDPAAANYDAIATIDDGSCDYLGCTDPEATNYDPMATIDDGSCLIEGCTDPVAANYNPNATVDNGSCSCEQPGCTDINALNFDPNATVDDGSCTYPISGCTDPGALNYNSEAGIDDGSCILGTFGCMDVNAFNYDPTATIDNGGCIPYRYGCMATDALNFIPHANVDDGSCIWDVCGSQTLWDVAEQLCIGYRPCPPDLDYNEVINVSDLLLFLSAYGTICD